jgi:hypothetical protein
MFIGDVVDLHSISFHVKQPEMPAPSNECEMAKREIKKWVAAFPKARVCIGNHDSRPLRLAQTVNIPEALLKDYADIWATPGWEWDWEFVIDDVCYVHGTDCGGENPAFTKVRASGVSYVMGHVHSVAGIKWLASPKSRVFGMDIGCGVNDRSMAFAYAKFARRRSIISCGVVIDGIPYHEVMPMSRGELYHDRRKR